jgi:hypothetical protein
MKLYRLKCRRKGCANPPRSIVGTNLYCWQHAERLARMQAVLEQGEVKVTTVNVARPILYGPPGGSDEHPQLQQD